MAEKVGDAYVELEVRDKKFNSQLSKSEKRLKRFKSRAKSVGQIGLVLAAGAAFSVRALSKQIDAETKLAAVLHTTGNSAGFSAEQLQKRASELQNMTRFGDEAILESQALIATFKNIKGDEFTRTTKAVLDMAAVMGTDAKGAAIQLGKALNDPTKNASMLSRAGITLTDVQLDQIKNFQDVNDLASAQGILLKELESEFGGVSEAMADTFGGRLDQAKNAFGDLQESIGSALGAGQGSAADIILKLTIRMQELSSVVDSLGDSKGMGKFVDMVGWAVRKLEEGAAFLGALSAGEGLRGAVALASSVPAQLAAERRSEFTRRKAAAAAGKGAIDKRNAAAAAKAADKVDAAGGAGGASAKAKGPVFVGFAEALKEAQKSANPVEDKAAKQREMQIKQQAAGNKKLGEIAKGVGAQAVLV